MKKANTYLFHWDTTSKSFQGQYIMPERSKEDDGSIEITYGYSKDMRKDLKQMKFGFGVTRDKIPLFADVLSGNMDDKTWNGDVITTVKEWLTFVDPAKVLHVADSALVTKDNLLSIDDSTYKFISRLPATFKLEKELREWAISKPELWNQIGKLTDKDDAATYKIQSFFEELEGKRYRFVVCYFDHLDARNERSIDKEIDAELKMVSDEVGEHISKDGYYCEADAKSAVEKYITQVRCKYHLIRYTVSEDERYKKTYNKR
ncbi:MAG: hypothetical protein BWY74_02739 [Firmicutes bacterium ADurb.Bin419]|nr:MAG: hypothetical protein BWY74_02739 [Firmicutes bacterium ADurb.Bin419]